MVKHPGYLGDKCVYGMRRGKQKSSLKIGNTERKGLGGYVEQKNAQKISHITSNANYSSLNQLSIDCLRLISRKEMVKGELLYDLRYKSNERVVSGILCFV